MKCKFKMSEDVWVGLDDFNVLDSDDCNVSVTIGSIFTNWNLMVNYR